MAFLGLISFKSGNSKYLNVGLSRLKRTYWPNRARANPHKDLLAIRILRPIMTSA
jgi:hypothetical protein